MKNSVEPDSPEGCTIHNVWFPSTYRFFPPLESWTVLAYHSVSSHCASKLEPRRPNREVSSGGQSRNVWRSGGRGRPRKGNQSGQGDEAVKRRHYGGGQVQTSIDKTHFLLVPGKKGLCYFCFHVFLSFQNIKKNNAYIYQGLPMAPS